MRLGTSAKLLIAIHDLYQPGLTRVREPVLGLATPLTLEISITDERVDRNSANHPHNGKDVAFSVGIVD